MPPAPDASPAPAEARPRHRAAILRLLLIAMLAPTVFLGPLLLGGKRLLPHLPVTQPPLSLEHPETAAEAERDIRYGPADRVFPTLSDQVVAREEWRDLSLPTWAPNLGLGAPLFANSIAGLAYPPNWLALVAPPDVAAAPLAWLTLVLAGLGMGLFLRRLGLSSWGVAAGVLGVQCGGWGLANVVYFMKVDAIVWLPWCLWAVEGIARGARRSSLALTLCIGLSFLAGFPPIAVFSLAATGAYALLRFSALGGRMLGLDAGERVDGADAAFVRLAARALGAALLGLAIGAWQLLPTIEASAQSVRQSKGPAQIADEALPASTLAGVLVPDLVAGPGERPLGAGGPAMAWWLAPFAEREKARNANVLEWNTYAGIALVLLAVGALFGATRRAVVPALALVGCYAFAQNWFGVGAVLYRVPGLGAGAPNRVLAVAWMLWAWLAALGVEALVGGAVAASRQRARIAVLVACLLGGAAAGFAAWRIDAQADAVALQDELFERYQALPEPPTRAVVESFVPREAAERALVRVEGSLARASGLALALGAAAAVFLLRRRGRALAPVGAGLVLAVVLVDGAWTAARHLPRQDPRGLATFPESEALEAVRAAAGDGRVVRLVPDAAAAGSLDAATGALVRGVERLGRPNLLQVYGIADLTPWTVFTPRGLVELVGGTAPGAGDGLDPAARFRSGIAGLSTTASLDHPLLDLLRVSCVLTEAPLEHPSLELAWSRPGFCVYRRAGALPVAAVVGSAVETPSDEVARGMLVSGAFDARTSALLAPGLPARPPVPGAEGATIDGVSRPSRSRLDLSIRGSKGGLLVMHEQFVPGWKATINGVDADVLRVDHVYRGLWLPEGDLVVRTKYEPWSLRAGFALALLSLASSLWLAFRRGV